MSILKYKLNNEWKEIFNTIANDTLPIGTILMYPSTEIPEGYRLCDGSELNREEYSDLFNIIGTTYGEGNGTTTFNLPDLRDKFVLSAGEDYFIGDIGGEKKHKLTIAEMPSHYHTLRVNQQAGGSWAGAQGSWGTGYTGQDAQMIAPSGGGEFHNNMPPYIVTTFIIKVLYNIDSETPIIDNLNSTRNVAALSANQGRILNEKVEELEKYKMMEIQGTMNLTAGNVIGYNVDYSSVPGTPMHSAFVGLIASVSVTHITRAIPRILEAQNLVKGVTLHSNVDQYVVMRFLVFYKKEN